MGPTARQRGQAAVELVAATPVLIVALLLVAQLAVAGHALWSAGDAARAGARAVLVGGDVEGAALRALPPWLDGDARVQTSEGGAVEVRVGAPALIPGVPAIAVEAAAALDPRGAEADG